MATPDPGSKPSPTSTGSVSGSTVERVQALDVACSSSPRPADVDEPMGEVEEQSRSRKACSDGSDGPSTDTDDPHSEVRPPKRARQRIINGHERETSTHRLSPSPPVKLLSPVGEMTPPTTPETPVNTVGGLPMEAVLLALDHIADPDIVSLSQVSRALRRAIISRPALWSKEVVLSITTHHFLHKLETYLARSGALGIHRIIIFLRGPVAVAADSHDARPDFYWQADAFAQYNLPRIQSVYAKYGQARRPSTLSIRLDGSAMPSLGATGATWDMLGQPWCGKLRNLSVSFDFYRMGITPAIFIRLARVTPHLEHLELDSPGMFSERPPPRNVCWGPSTLRTTALQRDELCSQPVHRLITLKIHGCLLPSDTWMPSEFPRLRVLEINSTTWGRTLFDMLRKSPALESLKLLTFTLFQEAEGDLPMDTVSEDWEFDEVIEDPAQSVMRPTPIFLTQLRYLELDDGAPPIWCVLGEMVQNASLHMDGLEELRCRAVDFDAEEIALSELTTSAPNLRRLSVRECEFNEAELYQSIRSMPHIEKLDLRGNESLNSDFISYLALAVPHLRHLDVRQCRFVSPIAVARLAETMRDSSEGLQRLEAIGIDQPRRPPGVDGPGEGGHVDTWNAWRWLEFTHNVLDATDAFDWPPTLQELKGKAAIRPEPERAPLKVMIPHHHNRSSSDDLLDRMDTFSANLTPDLASALRCVVGGSGGMPDIGTAASVAAEVADAASLVDETMDLDHPAAIAIGPSSSTASV